MLSNLKVNALKTTALKTTALKPYTCVYTTQVYKDFPDSHRLIFSTKYFPFFIETLQSWVAEPATCFQHRLKPPSQEIWLGNEKHVTTWKGATVVVGQGHA